MRCGLWLPRSSPKFGRYWRPVSYTHLDVYKRQVNLEKLIGEIIDGLTDSFPAQLPMIEQGRFAIGYYHQKQAFYKKSISDQEQ